MQEKRQGNEFKKGTMKFRGHFLPFCYVKKIYLGVVRIMGIICGRLIKTQSVGVAATDKPKKLWECIAYSHTVYSPVFRACLAGIN